MVQPPVLKLHRSISLHGSATSVWVTLPLPARV